MHGPFLMSLTCKRPSNAIITDETVIDQNDRNSFRSELPRESHSVRELVPVVARSRCRPKCRKAAASFFDGLRDAPIVLGVSFRLSFQFVEELLFVRLFLDKNEPFASIGKMSFAC